ncbi:MULTISPECIES: TetR/AcrR family transcriptional regulator [unclassified Streptomyces]|uniref:TetR/AcrR family transcriptional regulator n=1 Tax=unclassified Streptomyces TaxID=2593676 RepID=UPI001F0392D8|nr:MULTISPECIES: TetR/AcrR family transcriptional regulator [unclassified Streptomyces]MCH0567034.1 TetR/AcrR family transcriptional regulator [Streptomyces sp. MUM 2J]MCH0572401.1 TetR/AcrR family transcriptional regulator [Streptomyces sp. MUM 136J]
MAKGKVSKDDWTMAALRALARGGVAAVAVDVLARELGVTRGSFYWHFENREALLVAALETWERHGTAEVIATVREEADPLARARTLFAEALGDEKIAGLEPALAAQTGHPAVAEVVARVTRARLSFLEEVCAGLGFGPRDARHRALAAYAAYLGWLELRRTAPDSAPEAQLQGPGSAAALDHLVDMVLAPGGTGTVPA